MGINYQLMQPPTGCAADDFGAELVGDVGVVAGREREGAGAALVATPRASCPSVPSTSVTRCTEPVWTSAAPGTAAAIAFAALCCPGGYSTAVAVVASVESTAATVNPA